MFNAAIVGQWNFLVQLHVDTNVDLQCDFTANVLDKDGKDCFNVVASPDMNYIQARRQMLADDKYRTKEMTDLRLLPVNDRTIFFILCSFSPSMRSFCRMDQIGYDFRIPAGLMDFLNTDPPRKELYERLPVLKEPLTMEYYKERMHLLLHLEEFSRIFSQRTLDRILVDSSSYFVDELNYNDLTASFF
ncbi:hypothetical protein RvY_15937-2 [Ramazzottius varieornatus]|uniref:Helicase MOV-10 helical domain-containing protein n=1 Tax=Ramazzottius varieornatus TaxID=947166 RepID=A0A1D1W3C0_RAMVA|nr:hypothetical protein RvY_15937-2 [Ramazzottius varieornatus]